MKKKCKWALIFLLLFSFFLFNCKKTENNHGAFPVFTSYLDIPGVTDKEIAAIEEIKSRRDFFIYGMMLSTETFLNSSGEIGGFTALMCEWLTGLFGIEFVPRLYSFHDLLAALAGGEIDFNGGLTPNEERRKTYFMTDPIALRSLIYLRIEGSPPLSEIRQTRLPRYILQERTAIAADVSNFSGGTFEPVYIQENNQAYNILKSYEADAFITEGVMEIFFDEYFDVEAEDFFPLIFSPVSFSTQNPSLSPFISVVQKALENNAINYLYELYDQGHRDYLKQKLFFRLTDEEKKFIGENPVIPFGMEFDNYPVSFFNARPGEWQGISFDVIRQIESLTGLEFPVVNDEHARFYELLEMLKSGEIHVLSEVIRTPEQEKLFLWPDNSFITERSVLISRLDHPNININRVHSVSVGLTRGSAHTEFFLEWFPNHPHTRYYDSQEDAFNALLGGEVDMVINSYSTLLYLLNFQELPDFKANIIFGNTFKSTFGINKDQVILCSIIDKALELIDTNIISEQWRHRTYDYRLKVAEARTPWLIMSFILLLLLMILIIGLFRRSLRTGKNLEDLVQKRTYELALQTSTLATLFDTIPDLIFTKNLNLTFLHCNKAFLEHFGRSIDDIVGKSDEEGLGLPFEIAEEYREWDRKVIYNGLTTKIEEYIPRYDGTAPLLETIKTPLLLEGKTIGIMGIARDITQRKDMEYRTAARYEYSKNLNDSLAKITKSSAMSAGDLKAFADFLAKEGCYALETSRVSVWSIAENAKSLKNISCYNSYAAKHTIDDDFDLVKHKEYAKLLNSERLIVTTNIRSSVLFNEGLNQNLCAMLDAPIRIDGNLVGMVCAAQDRCEEFAEKREWEIKEQNFVSSLADLMALAMTGFELRKARDDAETASQTKSSFLANMSHEIRTPMNAILGVTEMLIENKTIPVEIEEGLDTIYNSCDLLLGIINDILDFSKIEAGKMDIMPDQYKIASLINDSTHLNLMRINTKPIIFELDVDESIPAKLIGDELRIKQILNNLLTNAYKYTDAGKIILSVSSQPAQNGVTLVLSVRDTGHGMTKEQVGRMFEEYSRFNQKKNITVEGTGLGLAITQRLVKLMNGDIHVESEPGKGTFFVIRVPQLTVDSEVLGKDVAENLKQFRLSYMTQKKRGHFSRDPMPYGSVLIVDDVETNLYVAVGLMKLYHLQIETAMSGVQAVNKIREGKIYDIIFMDHMMPQMDGMEAAKRLRDLGYTSSIVALTANAVAGQAEMFLENGFDEFISKPIDIRQLNMVLNKFIRDKQPAEVIESARRQKAIDNGDIDTSKDPLLLKSFIRDARKAQAALEELYEKGEFEKEEELRKFTIAFHGIKSSFWIVGETELAGFADRLEAAGREMDINMIKESTPEFLGQLGSYLKKVESMQEEDSGNLQYSRTDIEDLCDKLQVIQKMCSDYDKKGVLEMISEISYYTEKTKNVLDGIKKMMLHSEFEEAANAAAAYAADINNQKGSS